MYSILYELVDLKKWFMSNKQIWFGSTESDDIEISKKYSHLFEKDINPVILMDNIKSLSDGQDELDGSDELDKLDVLDVMIGYTILQDQISRHVKRANQLSELFVLDKLDKL